MAIQVARVPRIGRMGCNVLLKIYKGAATLVEGIYFWNSESVRAAVEGDKTGSH